MINLHAIYYRNIGPFEDKECSLTFNQGKFLIKSPIGSGKSFLFFDGPTYALYRTANRNMLNVQSKEGEISLIFSTDDQYYLVKRMLKAGKTKDSCSSQLFTISCKEEVCIPPVDESNKEVLQRDTNLIADLTANPERHVEEIVMKNETDLQQTLDQLLPPKSVFLSTIFLLQDADNIFEMQPADRLTVLKNVFGLLGIDEAKEQVQDKKREISYKLKALQDHSHQDNKLRKWLHELHNNYLSLTSHHCEDESNMRRNNLKTLEPFFADITPFFDQITLNDFTLNGLDIQIFLTTQEELKTQEKSLLTLQTTKDHLTKQINDLSDQLTKGEQEKKKLMIDITRLEQQISSIDVRKIEQLKQEKRKLYEEQTTLETGSKQFRSNYSTTISSLSSYIPSELRKKVPNTIEELSAIITLIQTLKEYGKELANQVQLAEQQLKSLQREAELEAKNQQIKLEQLEQAKKRLVDFEININQQATFACKDIGGNCPYITVINKQHFDQLEKQKKILQEEMETLQQQCRDISCTCPNDKITNECRDKLCTCPNDKTTNECRDKLCTCPNDKTTNECRDRSCTCPNDKTTNECRDRSCTCPNGEAVHHPNETIQQHIQHHKQQIETIKTFLTDIDYKSREDKYEQKNQLQTHISQLDQSIMKGEAETKKLQDYQQQKTAFSTSLQNLEQQTHQLQTKSETLRKEKSTLEQQIYQQHPEELKTQLATMANLLQTIHDIQQLITDATANRNLIKDLQQQEKLLSNLYTILSKEILLIALGEYLPVLSEIINSYLIQVVNYQISMKITETTEKLELEAKIYNEKGEREVKSLSGGQRTILKLVRMLAISSYLNTPLLFLDETINNLDKETVGKVSEMLNNFVKQRTMKFYTVTHNTEIQEMGIWDNVIEV